MRRRRYWGTWEPIETAPLDKEVMLLVTDGRGEPYPLPWPSKQTAVGWINSGKSNPLSVTPVMWRTAVLPRSPAWASKGDSSGNW